MAEVVVFGIAGEDHLWLADLKAGTVTRIDPPKQGALADADALRKAGATVVKTVNLAATASTADAVFGGFLDG
ncbi:hypothetical protein I6F07_14755 [Ensifer sp. IC4062]|nr:hypothetical protein [Ensifer sp. IC4062]MCA1441455.1 hypothetical protein [Ensifer sp. IC4062]